MTHHLMAGPSITGGERPSRPKLKIWGVLLLACLAVSSCDQRPSDADVLSYFAEHRAALETIVGLFAQDIALSRVAIDDPSRANPEIRAQLERLDLSLVARDLESGGLLFALHEAGIGISGASKGLLYAERLPPDYSGKLVDDIDLAFAAARQWQKNHESLDVTFIRSIEGPWYLHFETY